MTRMVRMLKGIKNFVMIIYSANEEQFRVGFLYTSAFLAAYLFIKQICLVYLCLSSLMGRLLDLIFFEQNL